MPDEKREEKGQEMISKYLTPEVRINHSSAHCWLCGESLKHLNELLEDDEVGEYKGIPYPIF